MSFKNYLTESFQDDIIKKYGLTKVSHDVGFSEKDQKWYGWSHRGLCGFGLGDKIFEMKFGDDKTLFKNHGKKPIKTLDDAKIAAERFSKYVS